MAKKNRTVLFAALSLMVSIAMLAGTTFAWFSDTVSNKGNRIRAGTLSVDLLKYETLPGGGGAYVSIADQTGSIFSDAAGKNGSNWEPGREETVYLQVKNKGSLELKYNLDIKVLDPGLADVLELSVASPYDKVTATASPGFVSLGVVASRMDSDGVISMAQSGELSVEGAPYTKGVPIANADFFAINVKMLESAGNTYQGLSFEADVILTATQTNKGAADNYDENAALVKVRTAAELAATPANATAVLLNDLKLTADMKFTHLLNIDYAGYTLDLDGNKLTVESGSIGTADLGTAKNGGAVKNGTIEINTPKGTVNAYGIYSASVTFNIIAVAPYTFNLYGSADGTVNLGDGRLVIHENGHIGALNRLDNAAGEYSIINNGTIGSLGNGLELPATWDGTSASYGWYDAGKTVLEISTAAELKGFANITNGKAPGITQNSFAGKTVRLTADINLNGKVWEPISIFNGTLDGSQKTISNLFVQQAGDHVGFIGQAKEGAVLKNISFDRANVRGGSYVAVLVGKLEQTNFGEVENIGVTNSAITGTANQWVGAVSGYMRGNAKDITVRNCTLEATGGKRKDLGAVFGTVISLAGESFTLTDIHAEDITVKGTRHIGGLIGTVDTRGIILLKNASVKNAAVTVDPTIPNRNGSPVIGCLYIASNYPAAAKLQLQNISVSASTVNGASPESGRELIGGADGSSNAGAVATRFEILP